MQTSASSTAVSRKKQSRATAKRCSRYASLHSTLVGSSWTSPATMTALQALWNPTPQAAGRTRSSEAKFQSLPNRRIGGIASLVGGRARNQHAPLRESLLPAQAGNFIMAAS